MHKGVRVHGTLYQCEYKVRLSLDDQSKSSGFTGSGPQQEREAVVGRVLLYAFVPSNHVALHASPTQEKIKYVKAVDILL